MTTIDRPEPGLRDAVESLLEWKADSFGPPEWLKSHSRDCIGYDDNAPMYGSGDENAPFFSEAFLYNLLGKEDARGLLARVRALGRAAGLSIYDLP